MTDPDWVGAEAKFKAFADRRGTLVRDFTDSSHFGNRLIEAAVDDLALRLVRDRGTAIVEVGDRRGWHNPRTLLGMAEGLSPAAALDRPEPALDEVIARWSEIAASAADPSLADFEEAMTDVYVARLDAKIVRERLAAA